MIVKFYTDKHGNNLDLFSRVVELAGRRPIRSVSNSRLLVPRVKLSAVTSRAFPVVGPQICNNLPQHVTSVHYATT